VSEPKSPLDKIALRRQLIAQREGLSAGEVDQRSRRIFERFVASSAQLLPDGFKNVAMYFPVRGEVETRIFFRHFQTKTKSCLFPKVVSSGGGERLDFFSVKDWAELQTGRFGIAEPQPLPGVAASQPDVVLVPGVAFARDAHRLGFGAGYYDRAVEAWASNGKRPRLIGLAYDFQVVPQLPIDPHDAALDFVISESEIFSRSKQ
jgi:5-formyltetrahydrofolate cyclo-ligase